MAPMMAPMMMAPMMLLVAARVAKTVQELLFLANT